MRWRTERSFSDVDDCIYCIDKLVRDPKLPEINIGPGPDEMITVNELFKEISNQLKFNKNPIDRKINEVKDAICSSNKAIEKLAINQIII